MKKLLYIYNPNAGRQKSREILSTALEGLSAQGYELTVVPTCGPGHAESTAFHMAPEYDRLVCCGGDGTLNEVVCGLLKLPEDGRPPLGYLPMGSTNDFSRNLDLPKTIEAQVALAGTGEGRPVDIGDSSGHPFTYVSAFGLFTEASYSTPQNLKNMLGHFAYILEGAGQLANIPNYQMTVTADGKEIAEGEFIYGMVGNTVSVGGLMNLPKNMVKLNDGKFEILLVRKPHSLKDTQEMLASLSKLQMPCTGVVEVFAASEVSFHCSRPVAWTVDGEFGGERYVTTVKNLHNAVSIVCGQKALL